MRITVVLIFTLGMVNAQSGQQAPVAKPKPAAVKTVWSCAKASSEKVRTACKLATSGLPEEISVPALKKLLPLDLAAEDLIGMKGLGVNDRLLGVMADVREAVKDAVPPPVEKPGDVVPGRTSCQPSSQSRKRVIAVQPFEGQAVTGESFYTPYRSQGMRVMFANRIVTQGQFVIVDREKLNDIRAEQGRALSGEFKLGKGPRRGQINGFDAVLACSILKYRYQDQRKEFSLPFVGRVVRGSEVAQAQISYQLIDSETSEVILTGEAQGDAKLTSQMSIGEMGASSRETNSAQKLLDEAASKAIDALADKINTSEQKVPRRWVPAEAYVSKLSDGRVYIDLGANDAVGRCDRFEVHEVVGEIKGKETAESIGLETRRVGELVALEVEDRMSIGAYTDGKPLFVGRNYVVRKMKPGTDVALGQ